MIDCRVSGGILRSYTSTARHEARHIAKATLNISANFPVDQDESRLCVSTKHDRALRPDSEGRWLPGLRPFRGNVSGVSVLRRHRLSFAHGREPSPWAGSSARSHGVSCGEGHRPTAEGRLACFAITRSVAYARWFILVVLTVMVYPCGEVSRFRDAWRGLALLSFAAHYLRPV